LISEDAEGFSAIAEKLLSKSDLSFSQLRGRLMAGSGLGQPIILAYSPSLKRQQVDGAIAHLKTTGLMAGIVSKVQAQHLASNQ
jgi:hypothetical protein